MKKEECRRKEVEAENWFNADDWALRKPQGSGSLGAGSGQFGSW